MNLKTILLLFLLTQTSFGVATAQANYLEAADEYLISPQDVSWNLKEQNLLYITRYENAIDTLNIFEEEYREDILRLEAKNKVRNRDRKMVKALEEYIEELQIEKEKLATVIKQWEYFKLEESTVRIEELALDSDCYDLVIGGTYYGSDEYEIVETKADDVLYWYEVYELIGNVESEKVETTPAITKWVKKKADRNCLSADPADCLVWCLVEIPAQYKTETRRTGGECEAPFEVDELGENCSRRIEVQAGESSSKGTKKVIEVSSKRELDLVGVRILKCE